MTTKPRAARTFPPLPDPPERKPEDMTSFDHLTKNGGAHHLAQHFGHPDTTVVGGERYIIREPDTPAADRRFPDLLIAFGADPEAYQDSNSYVISEQGKPPDFVMEIASESTGQEDTGNKRTWYADLGIPEYWRFDQTGRFHGSRLAGDRLVDGRYEPITIEEIEEEVLQGYSAALGLFVRWERGELRWHDPETGQEIPTFEQEREGRLAEREARLAEQEARLSERGRQVGRTGSQAGGRGPGQGAGGRTGTEKRRRLNSFEILASLDGPPHAQDCGCQPCQIKRACLQKVMTFIARSSPGVFELVEAWTLTTGPAQGRGGVISSGPDGEIAVRTMGVLTAGRNRALVRVALTHCWPSHVFIPRHRALKVIPELSNPSHKPDSKLCTDRHAPGESIRRPRPQQTPGPRLVRPGTLGVHTVSRHRPVP